MATSIIRVLLLIFFFLAASGAAAQDYEIEEDYPAQHLYFTDLAKVDRFETVTVFITEGKPDKVIADAFFDFAELIGRDNGATRVDANDYRRYSDILTRLKCRPIRSEEIPAVVFAAKTLSCQVFPLSNPKALREILFTIQRNISCPKDLLIERVAQEARAAVKELANSVPQTKALLRPSNELIDFLAEQLRITCKGNR